MASTCFPSTATQNTLSKTVFGNRNALLHLSLVRQLVSSSQLLLALQLELAFGPGVQGEVLGLQELLQRVEEEFQLLTQVIHHREKNTGTPMELQIELIWGGDRNTPTTPPHRSA